MGDINRLGQSVLNLLAVKTRGWRSVAYTRVGLAGFYLHIYQVLVVRKWCLLISHMPAADCCSFPSVSINAVLLLDIGEYADKNRCTAG